VEVAERLADGAAALAERPEAETAAGQAAAGLRDRGRFAALAAKMAGAARNRITDAPLNASPRR
jgi:hypothetical protein